MLARAQFALTIMFHYLFPPLSIGLGGLIVVMEALFLIRKDRDYEKLARFFTRLFAVNFAVGVASGIVMEFQFGTNWASYSRYVGDVFGSALAAEGIFAFFLESGFLAVLVFGWDRVGPRMHFFSTLMVFLGSVFSSVWIVIANSWQQTPAGHHIVGEGGNERAEIIDFWAMVFNPSAMHRLGHVLLGAFVVGGFFVMSISAFYVLRGRHLPLATKSFKVSYVYALVASLLLFVSGHSQAVAVAHNQPAKIAAFEGHYKTGPAPLWLVGMPDDATKEVRGGIGIPGLLSFLVHGDTKAYVKGLDDFPPEDRPPTKVPFLAYHLMIGLGSLHVGLLALGAFFLRKGRIFQKRWLLRAFVVAVVGPYLANEAGWVSAEVGRQPWAVYGLLRTKDAVSKVVPSEHIVTSIVTFALLYSALFFIWLFVMNEKIKHGPADDEEVPSFRVPDRLSDVASMRADPASPASLTLPRAESKETP